MRVLIANPGFRIPLEGGEERYFLGAGCRFPWSLRKRRSEPPRFAMFPFFLAYSAALLERDDFDVKVIDGVPLNLDHREFIEHAVSVKPQLILFEPATPMFNSVSCVARELSARTSAKIVFAGPHATTFSREILRDHPHVDFVLIGEYEMAFLQLAQRLRSGSVCSGLRGIAYRTAGGQYARGERAAEIDPVDQLPVPARHLFPSFFNSDLGVYHDGFCQHRPAIQLHSSRGCPFRCSYCLWTQAIYNNGKHRCFTPERVVQEMIEARDKYGAREIYFDDDDFTARKEHVLLLCAEMKRQHVNLPWSVMGDFMVTDDETLTGMAKAGCIGIKFGLESVDPAILKRAGKPIRPERVCSLVNTAKRLGMKTHMTVMFGLPGETFETLTRTFDFACKLATDSIQFSIATPYPGTRLYDELKEQNRLRFEAWEEFDGANSAVYECESVERKFLEQFQASAHGSWLRRRLKDPRWIGRQAVQLYRLIGNQGWAGFFQRVKRSYHLLNEPFAPHQSAALPSPKTGVPHMIHARH